jgi:hypothetical protein
MPPFRRVPGVQELKRDLSVARRKLKVARAAFDKVQKKYKAAKKHEAAVCGVFNELPEPESAVAKQEVAQIFNFASTLAAHRKVKRNEARGTCTTRSLAVTKLEEEVVAAEARLSAAEARAAARARAATNAQ